MLNLIAASLFAKVTATCVAVALPVLLLHMIRGQLPALYRHAAGSNRRLGFSWHRLVSRAPPLTDGPHRAAQRTRESSAYLSLYARHSDTAARRLSLS
ncbi:hypothetical protein Micbo1qcDRAFT_52455 [Microdochium bolleyi]|uniref:Uncharacterized protein n=1 Tax=Microdochium bolleyi TaxID=196109 RepID=A0A136J760_9PEZI|nr:hypothetical protein Micbo1qcDRAFT_52455 [Microdochium bolleyi]